MSPVAVAREPHHLPGLAVDGQRLGPCQASVRIKSDGAGRNRRRRRLAAEQLLGRRCGIVGLGKCRKRCGIERALVLRRRRARRNRQDRKKEEPGAKRDAWLARFAARHLEISNCNQDETCAAPAQFPASLWAQENEGIVSGKVNEEDGTGMSGPLAGVKVLELSGIGSGPFCAMLLADMGAD